MYDIIGLKSGRRLPGQVCFCQNDYCHDKAIHICLKLYIQKYLSTGLMPKVIHTKIPFYRTYAYLYFQWQQKFEKTCIDSIIWRRSSHNLKFYFSSASVEVAERWAMTVCFIAQHRNRQFLSIYSKICKQVPLLDINMTYLPLLSRYYSQFPLP